VEEVSYQYDAWRRCRASATMDSGKRRSRRWRSERLRRRELTCAPAMNRLIGLHDEDVVGGSFIVASGRHRQLQRTNLWPNRSPICWFSLVSSNWALTSSTGGASHLNRLCPCRVAWYYSFAEI